MIDMTAPFRIDPQAQRGGNYARQRQMTLSDLLMENRIIFLGSSPDRELRQEVSVYIQSELKKVGIDETIDNATFTGADTAEDSGDYGMTATSFITASPAFTMPPTPVLQVGQVPRLAW